MIYIIWLMAIGPSPGYFGISITVGPEILDQYSLGAIFKFIGAASILFPCFPAEELRLNTWSVREMIQNDTKPIAVWFWRINLIVGSIYFCFFFCMVADLLCRHAFAKNDTMSYYITYYNYMLYIDISIYRIYWILWDGFLLYHVQLLVLCWLKAGILDGFF